MSKIGPTLRKLRINKGLSAEEIARRLNVAASTYRDWENGRSIKGEPYTQLATILGVSISELLGATDDRSEELKLELQKAEDAIRRARLLL